jgi:hypothetical protein
MRWVLVPLLLSTPAWTHAQSRDLDQSQYGDVWKVAAPDPLAPQGRSGPGSDVVFVQEPPSLQTIHTTRAECQLYAVSPGRLLTICEEPNRTVIGLYEASQRRLDELSMDRPEYGGVELVRLTSGVRWDIRVERNSHPGRSEAIFYSDRDGKLARVAAFDSRYESAKSIKELLYPTGDRRSGQRSLFALRQYGERHDDSGETDDTARPVPVSVVLPVDEDHDGFNERLDLTTLRFAPANDDVVRFNSPRVTRTLTWNPKTHTYED